MNWASIFLLAFLFCGCVHRQESKVHVPSPKIPLLEQPFQEHVDFRLVAFTDMGFSPISFFDLSGNLVTIRLPDSNLEEWRKLKDEYEAYSSVPAEKKDQLLRKRVRPFPEDLKLAVYAVWKDGLTQLGDEDLTMKHLPPFGNRFWLRTLEGEVLEADFFDPEQGTVGKELAHVARVLSRYATYETSETRLRWALWKYGQATLTREKGPVNVDVNWPEGKVPEHVYGRLLLSGYGPIFIGDVLFYNMPLDQVLEQLTQQFSKVLQPDRSLTITCSGKLAQLPVTYIGNDMIFLDIILDIADQVGADLEFDGLEIKLVPRAATRAE